MDDWIIGDKCIMVKSIYGAIHGTQVRFDGKSEIWPQDHALINMPDNERRHLSVDWLKNLDAEKRNRALFTELEKSINDNLVAAWNAFVELKMTHPDHQDEFRKAIHQCQYIMGQRLLQRTFPDIYPTYNERD